MSSNSQIELIGNIVGIFVAAAIAVWVRMDARKRGLSAGAATGWGIGVFLLLIVFLPLYLWMRRDFSSAKSGATKSAAPIAGVPCRYCGYENTGDPDYCGKCGRQMRSSTDIHR